MISRRWSLQPRHTSVELVLAVDQLEAREGLSQDVGDDLLREGDLSVEERAETAAIGVLHDDLRIERGGSGIRTACSDHPCPCSRRWLRSERPEGSLRSSED